MVFQAESGYNSGGPEKPSSCRRNKLKGDLRRPDFGYMSVVALCCRGNSILLHRICVGFVSDQVKMA